MYESRKVANPTLDLSNPSPLNNVPFLPGFSGTSLKGKIVYFNPNVNDQGPKGLILSALSPESGEVVMPKFGGPSRAQFDLRSEVMSGYT